MKYVRVCFVLLKTKSKKMYFESQDYIFYNVKYFENFEPNFHLFVKFIFFVNDYFMKGTLYSIGVFWKNFSFFWTGSRLVLEILDVKSH